MTVQSETIWPDGRTTAQWKSDKERDALYRIMRDVQWVRAGVLRNRIEKAASALLAAKGQEVSDA